MYSTSGHLVRYHSFAKIAGDAVTLAGLLVSVGWITDVRLFKSILPGSHAIMFNTGISMFLCGLSLRLLLSSHRGSIAWRISQAAVCLAMLLGVVTITEYLGGLDFGINQLALPGYEAAAEQYPERMSLIGSIIFVLLGGALFLLGRDAAARWVEGLTLIAALNALVPAIGYLYGRSTLYQLPYYGTVALSATALYLLLCAAILASRPTRGLMSIISNNSAGGITARRLLPAAILLPIAIDRLQFWGRQAGLYDTTFGMIAMTLSSMVIFTLLIIWNAHLLMRLDQQRGEVEDALHESLDVLESNLNALTKTNTRLQAEKNVRRAVEENLFHEHERAQVTLNSITDGVITTDLEGHITYLNRAAERFSGWTSKEACGRPIGEIFKMVDILSRQPNLLMPQTVLQQNDHAHLPRNSILLRRNGTELAVEESCAPMHDREGKVVGVVLVLHDVSAVHAMSQRMSHLTQHDALTDLPNRFLLNDRLTQAIALALRHGTRTAVLFLDLDRFKQINDTLNHKIGDRLLQDIALRLKNCVRDTDTVSRYGGDAFALLLQEASDSMDAARTAAQILKSITEPYSIEGHEIHISASIGISICPEDGEDAESILKHAEAAMYQAKAQGRNNYQFFTRHINERTLQRFALERNLRHAIAREESVLYYQPKVRIADLRVIGAEALIRWNNRQDGIVVSPTQFIPIAEESGLIIPIGEWVLHKACEQARIWQEANYPPIPVAVNVSAVQFHEKHFLDLVARVLHETGLQPKYLELELTESVTMQDLELTVSLLESLKKMGINLSIDDFGTGYSSLSYLKRFPIDTLKIDRSFVQDITTDPDSTAIISAIISMAKSLKHEVIAEGVETQEQFEFLRRQGCDGIQGYYYSEPLAPKEFEERILRASTLA